MNSLFRLHKPSATDLDSFHNDGYIFFPAVFKEEGREKLVDEIHNNGDGRDYIDARENTHDAESKS